MATAVLAERYGGCWTQDAPPAIRAVAVVREPQRCSGAPTDGGGLAPRIEQLRPRGREGAIWDGEDQPQADRLHVRPRVVVV
eukprot:7392657-Pyramimonas_sp.AAC.1